MGVTETNRQKMYGVLPSQGADPIDVSNWVYDSVASAWVRLKGDSAGKLYVRSVEDAVTVQQTTPASLKALVHGVVPGVGDAIIIATDSIGRVCVAEISTTITQTPQNLARGWASAGSTSNPGLYDVLADTGALAAGTYDFTLIFKAQSASKWRIEHRNAANDTTIYQQEIGLTTEILTYHIKLEGWALAANERMRIIAEAAFTGWCIHSIIYVRRA